MDARETGDGKLGFQGQPLGKATTWGHEAIPNRESVRSEDFAMARTYLNAYIRRFLKEGKAPDDRNDIDASENPGIRQNSTVNDEEPNPSAWTKRRSCR